MADGLYRLSPSLLLSLLFMLCYLYPSTPTTPAAPNPLFPRDPDVLDCENHHSADYYGLGVRIGFYFQWLTSYLANTFLPDEIAGALDTNAVFLFALLVSMVRSSITGLLKKIDGLILMHLSGGTVFGILSLWGYRCCQLQREGPTAMRHFGGFGTHFRLLLSLAISIYGLWYWLRGVVGGLHGSNVPGCGTVYTFMFAKVRADGPIHVYYVFICVCCIVYFGVMLVASTLAGYERLMKVVHAARRRAWNLDTRLKFDTGFDRTEYVCSFPSPLPLLPLPFPPPHNP